MTEQTAKTVPDQPAKFEAWAIIEIMGHQRLAGLVSERTIAGTPMLQVDVPATNATEYSPAIDAFTTFLGGGSIYRLTPCTEAVARDAIRQFRVRPITCVDMPRTLPAPAGRPTGSDPDEYCPHCQCDPCQCDDDDGVACHA